MCGGDDDGVRRSRDRERERERREKCAEER